jgi:hypothetical protein
VLAAHLPSPPPPLPIIGCDWYCSHCCINADVVGCVPCRPPCADCLRDGERVPAEYSCMDAKCDLKALCDGHTTPHKRWGHAVSVLVAEGGGVAGCPQAPTWE